MLWDKYQPVVFMIFVKCQQVKLLVKYVAYIYDVFDFEYQMVYPFLFSTFVFHNAVSKCVMKHKTKNMTRLPSDFEWM
jgi:hypothetical protein